MCDQPTTMDFLWQKIERNQLVAFVAHRTETHIIISGPSVFPQLSEIGVYNSDEEEWYVPVANEAKIYGVIDAYNGFKLRTV